MIISYLKTTLGLDIKASLSCFMSLFAVIDPISTSVVVMGLRKRMGNIDNRKASIASFFIMLLFLFVGQHFLKLFGIDISSFALAGGIILFVLGLEMILGISITKIEVTDQKIASIIPVAFPMFIGASTFSTLVTMRIHFGLINILTAILANSICIFVLLKYSVWIEEKLGKRVTIFITKLMGIIILAISIKIFRTYLLNNSPI